MSLSSLAMCKGRFYLVIHIYLAGWKQKENTSGIRNGGAPLEIVAVEIGRIADTIDWDLSIEVVRMEK